MRLNKPQSHATITTACTASVIKLCRALGSQKSFRTDPFLSIPASASQILKFIDFSFSFL